MISEKHHCIFVHITKTGGQSIELAFAQLDGVDKQSMLLTENNDPKLGPPYLMHLMAEQYVTCGHVSKEDFDSYFKFGFVRNPWSRMVSLYKYFNYCKWFDFKTYLLKHFETKSWRGKYWAFAPQYDYLFDKDGNQLVDFIGKFESLEKDFKTICNKMDMPEVELPYVNKSNPLALKPLSYTSPKHFLRSCLRNASKLMFRERIKANLLPNYRDYYDQELIDFVGNIYKKDVEYFNYSFDS